MDEWIHRVMKSTGCTGHTQSLTASAARAPAYDRGSKLNGRAGGTGALDGSADGNETQDFYLDRFAETFLPKCTLGHMISRYMVLVASEQKLLEMHPEHIAGQIATRDPHLLVLEIVQFGLDLIVALAGHGNAFRHGSTWFVSMRRKKKRPSPAGRPLPRMYFRPIPGQCKG